MIIGGADVSGNTIGGGQHRYIAIVIGKEEIINRIHSKIGLTEIHMVRLDAQQKSSVRQNLDFKSDEILVLCIEVERQHIIDLIFSHARLHPKTRSRQSIQQKFDYHLLDLIKERIETFARGHKSALTDVIIQCESDMELTIKNWKMTSARRGKAYEISDAVAHFNEKGTKLKRCIELDLRDELRNRMEYDLLR
jgi:hypothetical protein